MGRLFLGKIPNLNAYKKLLINLIVIKLKIKMKKYVLNYLET